MLGIYEVLHEGYHAKAYPLLLVVLEVGDEEVPELFSVLPKELLRLWEGEGITDRPGVDHLYPASEML